MNEDQIKDLADDLYNIADNYQFVHTFDAIYYRIIKLANTIEDEHLKQERKYIVYANCKTFKSGLYSLEKAKEWQKFLPGSKIFMEVSGD